MPITAEQSVPEILAQYPETEGIFTQFGLQAEGYKALEYENLFATCRVHQIDLDALLSALNALLD